MCIMIETVSQLRDAARGPLVIFLIQGSQIPSVIIVQQYCFSKQLQCIWN